MRKAALAAGLLLAAGFFLAQRAGKGLEALAPPPLDEGIFREFFGGNGTAQGALWPSDKSPRTETAQGALWPSELGEIELSLGRLELPELQAEDLRVHLKPRSASDAKRGEFAQIVIRFSRLTVRGATVRDAVLEARDAGLDLAELMGNKRLRFTRLAEVRPSARVDAEELAKRVPGARPVDGGLEASGGRWRGRFDVRLSSGGDALDAGWEEFRWAGLPVPKALLARTWRRYSLLPTAARPFRIRLNSVAFDSKGLVID